MTSLRGRAAPRETAVILALTGPRSARPRAGSGRYAQAVSDYELGAFLRARREAVSPAEVGLPTGDRRRTPGLRRAELATLAGISVDYLVRLEQGRDRRPSFQILNAIADALRLTADERDVLRRAAKAASGGVCPVAEPPARSVRPSVRTLLERLEPTPAYVLNRLSDVLALTAGYARLVGPMGLLDRQPPNLARYVFTDTRARNTFPEWDRVADERVADLRFRTPGDDPHIAELTTELATTAGSAFRDRMRTPPRRPRHTGVETLVHPEVGELRLTYETLELPDAADDQRLIVYLPADDASSAALDRLTHGHTGTLRAVTG